VLERFGPEHDRGSSHGATRITRSSYHEPSFVRLATEAHRDGWPALERALGMPLRVPTPGVFFGPADGPFGDYLRATLSATGTVERLPTAAAAARFPLLRFAEDDAVLLDHSAAMLLAGATMQGLRAWLLAAGVEFRWHCAVAGLEPRRDGIRLETSGGIVTSRTAIVAAGAANAQLVPGHRGPLTVLHQQVGWFDVDAEPASLAAGAFPVWARIGRQPNDFQYGLPAHAGAGLKAAQHRTAGSGDGAEPPPIDRDALLALARERFTAPVRGLLATERCLYTMTRDQRFRVASGPHDPRIVGIAACSGHGFKFGPVIGRMAADAVLGVGPAPPT
jgi:sarcosine oxidase